MTAQTSDAPRAAKKPASRKRADVLLVERGLAASREKAQALVMAGVVDRGGERVDKPGQLLPVDASLAVRAALPFVSRGGLKLDEALRAFGLSVEGRIAVDLGASTGGFTDCLLQHGARRVYAVDVDTRQIDQRLRQDPRVVLIEKNARYLEPGDFPEKPEVVAADLSFISILKVLPALKAVLTTGMLLVLLKPQFEAGRADVGKRGIVRDPIVHARVLERVLREAGGMGLGLRGILRCATRGQKGNQEFMVWWSADGPGLDLERTAKLIREVTGYEDH
jgi:23S rRNA (cytidine1920-2'-O)/16S rRNA (cytidine1409-2'-O)-methyltransferase